MGNLRNSELLPDDRIKISSSTKNIDVPLTTPMLTVNADTSSLSTKSSLTKADISWYVTSSFKKINLNPEDQFAPLDNGELGILTYDLEQLYVNINNQFYQLYKNTSTRCKIMIRQPFKILVSVKCRKNIGKNITNLQYNIPLQLFSVIVKCLEENGTYVINYMHNVEYRKISEFTAIIRRCGIMFKISNCDSFIGFRKQYVRTFGVFGHKVKVDGKTYVRICCRLPRKNCYIDCGTTQFDFTNMCNETSVDDSSKIKIENICSNKVLGTVCVKFRDFITEIVDGIVVFSNNVMNMSTNLDDYTTLLDNDFNAISYIDNFVLDYDI